jgi:hypothetical protein
VDPRGTPFGNVNRLRFTSGNYGDDNNDGPPDGGNGPHKATMMKTTIEIMDLHPTMITTILHQICLQGLVHMLIIYKPKFDHEQLGGIYVETWQTTMIYHL